MPIITTQIDNRDANPFAGEILAHIIAEPEEALAPADVRVSREMSGLKR